MALITSGLPTPLITPSQTFFISVSERIRCLSFGANDGTARASLVKGDVSINSLCAAYSNKPRAILRAFSAAPSPLFPICSIRAIASLFRIEAILLFPIFGIICLFIVDLVMLCHSLEWCFSDHPIYFSAIPEIVISSAFVSSINGLGGAAGSIPS